MINWSSILLAVAWVNVLLWAPLDLVRHAPVAGVTDLVLAVLFRLAAAITATDRTADR